MWDVTFGDPYLLCALVVVPLVLAIVLIGERRPSRHPMSFTNVQLLAGVVAGRRSWWNRVPLALLLLGLAAAAIAVARPRTHVTVTQHNTTVVLLVDVSGSMSSTDVAPSRISAAVAAMQVFLARLPKDVKAGLVEFSTVPEVLSSPTPDHSAVDAALVYLQPEGATALGDGIGVATQLIQSSLAAAGAKPSSAKAPSGAIVLLSDGAQNRGTLTPLGAAARAKADGIRIYTVALGTPDGTVNIPGLGPVRVPPDPATMRAISKLTGGKTFTAQSADTLSSVYRGLGTQVATRKQEREITSWFALAAALFLLAGFLADRLRRSAFP